MTSRYVREDCRDAWDGHRGHVVEGAPEAAGEPPWGVRVPSGHLWLEGDNPDNSTDSRTYGPVPAALVRGTVVAKLWPPGRSRRIARLPRGDAPVWQDDTGGEGRTAVSGNDWTAWKRSADVNPLKPGRTWTSACEYKGSVVYYAGEEAGGRIPAAKRIEQDERVDPVS
mmetsp:Transcript_43734/g.85819  ORF Transcript_43734/g.85819 Transcript_43734/m.85819 type:complete len:169 (-) Transcript_43734:119-625(-)